MSVLSRTLVADDSVKFNPAVPFYLSAPCIKQLGKVGLGVVFTIASLSKTGCRWNEKPKEQDRALLLKPGPEPIKIFQQMFYSMLIF